MKTQDLTHNQRVVDIIEELKSLRAANPAQFRVSDVVDAEGNQYVDLVQEGGGVLGVALLGYTYLMEQMGIRFVSMAGTSAGAINTMLLACAGQPNEVRSTAILDLLVNKDLSDFIDGDKDVQKFIDTILDEDSSTYYKLWRALFVFDDIYKNIGLNPGKGFREWLRNTMSVLGIQTQAQLTKRMNTFPPSIGFKGDDQQIKELPNLKAKLAIIGADLTTETKAEFPEMNALYFEEPDQASPADYVRASMSIPLFFEPFRLKVPQNEDSKELWKQFTGYVGEELPKEVLLVDGGVLSNFPIDVFHVSDRPPTRPTFGAKLGLDRNQLNEIENWQDLLSSTFFAAMNMHDKDFIDTHPDYKHLITQIAIDNQAYNWLDFRMGKQDKIDLFVRGAEEAAAFLKKFDWEKYKAIRLDQLKSVLDAVFDEKRDDYLALLTNAVENKEQAMMVTKSSTAASRDLSAASAQERATAPALFRRLRDFENQAYKGSILWIDDCPERECDEKNMLRKMEIVVDEAKTSAEALQLLEEKDYAYSMIISDIKREDNPIAGLTFANNLMTAEKDSPPIIFYITNQDKTKGVPVGAFNITNSPVELMHLVLDIMGR